MKKSKVFSGNDLMMFVSDLFDEYLQQHDYIIMFNFNGIVRRDCYGFNDFIKCAEPHVLNSKWKLDSFEGQNDICGLFGKVYYFNFKEA